MAIPSHNRKSIAPEAHAIYDAELRHKVEPHQNGKFLSLDVDTGDYEIHSSNVIASNRLHDRRPGARVFTFKIGYPTMGRFGGPRLPKGAKSEMT